MHIFYLSVAVIQILYVYELRSVVFIVCHVEYLFCWIV